MSTVKKSVVTRKSGKDTSKAETVAPAVVAPVASVAPTPAVVAPAVVAPAVVAPAPTVVAPAVAETPVEETSAPVEEQSKRPRVRNFAELYETCHDELHRAYDSLKLAVRAIDSMKGAHERDLKKTNRSAAPATVRRATTLLDSELVAFFRSMLTDDERRVTVKDGGEVKTISLADLSTETRVHRTDVTQLYSLVFKKHGLADEKDGRIVVYTRCPALQTLLTTGSYDPAIEADVQAIRDGTFVLNIFNIQRFTSQHLHTSTEVEATA
jgi:hypothetical protein